MDVLSESISEVQSSSPAWVTVRFGLVVISLISKYGCLPRVQKAKNIKNTCNKAWKIVSNNKL